MNKSMIDKVNQCIYISIDALNIIMERIKETGQVNKAIIELKEEQKIFDDVSNSTYKFRLTKFEPYNIWLNEKKEKKKQLINNILRLHNEGLSNLEIAKKLNHAKSCVNKIIIKSYRDHQKKDELTAEQKEYYQSFVDYWYNNPIIGNRFMTLETKTAFEKLKLELPV